eukprot:m.133922 g.133922  ORF g.133922 m.133922 type:complete len:1478 (-) comp9868_c1_seq2:1800-6233(-)
MAGTNGPRQSTGHSCLALASTILLLAAVSVAPAEGLLISWWRFNIGSDGLLADSQFTNDGQLYNSPVVQNGYVRFRASQQQYGEIPHTSSMSLKQATFWVRFRVTNINTRQGLFSKDLVGQTSDGELFAFVKDGRVCVRLEDANDGRATICSMSSELRANAWHDLLVYLGPKGFSAFLDNRRIGKVAENVLDLTDNRHPIVIGALQSKGDLSGFLSGDISDFAFFDTRINPTLLDQAIPDERTTTAEPDTTTEWYDETTTAGPTEPPIELVQCPEDVVYPAVLRRKHTTAFWSSPKPLLPQTTVSYSATAAVRNSSFPIGTTEVVITAKDHSAISSVGETIANTIQKCKLRVKVTDVEPPVFSCPADIVANNEAGRYAARVAWTVPTATDNSGQPVVIHRSHDPGSYYPVGKTRVRIIGRDVFRNEHSCTFLITVRDKEAPRITCPNNVEGTTDIGSAFGRASWRAQAVDNSAQEIDITYTDRPGVSQFPIGQTTVTAYAVDEDGNESSCDFIVLIHDGEPPVIKCPEDVEVPTAFRSDMGSATWSDDDVEVSDNSGSDVTIVSSVPSGYDQFHLGVNSVTYTATDPAGNENYCSFAVIVVDEEPPQITCPDDVVVATLPGADVGQATWPQPTTSDNSGGVVFVRGSRVSGSLFQLDETLVVTYTAVDEADNIATCDFTVTVIDVEPPRITCPESFTSGTDRRMAKGTVFWPEPSVLDNSRMPITIESNFDSGESFPLGVTTIIYTATDAFDNSAQCSFDVTIVDRETPLITCPDSQFITTDPGKPTATAFWNDPVVSDNSGLSVTLTSQFESGYDGFEVGSTFVQYTATDSAGNTRTCSFRINVQDDELPVLTCPADIVVGTSFRLNTAMVEFDDAAVSDNSQKPVTLSSSRVSGDLFVLGTTTVLFTAVDQSGNRNGCQFTVTVLDIEPPQITCPDDVESTTDTGLQTGFVEFVDAETRDNSFGFVELESDIPTGSDFPIGTTVVTFTATDPDGNTATCSFTVKIFGKIFLSSFFTDDEPPVITGGGSTSTDGDFGQGAPGSNCAPRQCPTDVIAEKLVGSEFDYGIATWIEPIVCDNSGGAVEVVSSHQSGEQFPVGDTTVTITATDSAGNSDTCTFTVSIIVPTIFITGRIVSADTGSSIGGVPVTLGSYSASPPPRPPPVRPRSTTTAAPTTTMLPETTPYRPARDRRPTTEDYYTTTPQPDDTTTDDGNRRRRRRRDLADEPVDGRRLVRARRESKRARRIRREALMGEVVANADGVFVFEVPIDPAQYTVAVVVEGVEAQADFEVAGRDDLVLDISVPDIQSPDEYQITAIWLNDDLASHNDFDAVLVTPYEDECVVNFINDFCFDDSRDSFLNLNYRNNRNGAGPETMTILGDGGVYHHFLYGQDLASSFVGSQLQVAVYNLDGLVSKLHVSANGALAAAANPAARFWHTFSVDTATGIVTVVNEISCTPFLSTGSLDSLMIENGARGC